MQELLKSLRYNGRSNKNAGVDMRQLAQSFKKYDTLVLPGVLLGVVHWADVFFTAFPDTSSGKHWLPERGEIMEPVIALIWVMAIVNFWNLADKVFDFGEHLVIKRRFTEVHVSLSDIVSAGSGRKLDADIVTLRLARRGPLGTKVQFIRPAGCSGLATELEERAEKARQMG